MSANAQTRRVLSGVRPLGPLHLGHYHGAIRQWVELQYQYECFFYVADWQMLASGYEDTSKLQENIRVVVIDCLTAGINPGVATLFIQSQVPEHAELFLLLSMITPTSWLERVASPNDQPTYGALGQPAFRSAEILLHQAALIPLAEDETSQLEIPREIARRFNHLYGREPDFEEKAERGVKSLGGRNTTLYRQLRRRFQETGETQALERARALVQGNNRITVADRERLLGYLEGTGVSILQEPQPLVLTTPRVPGIDGRPMSHANGNTIGLREDPDSVAMKLRTMQTDPARVRRTDPGDPEKCPVWDLHLIYSDEKTRSWVNEGCRSAGIGCLDCKKPVIDKVVEEVTAMRKRAQEFEDNADLVRNIVTEGVDKAREAARETLDDVRRAMHLRAD